MCGRFCCKPKPYVPGVPYTIKCSQGHEFGHFIVPNDKMLMFSTVEQIIEGKPLIIEKPRGQERATGVEMEP